LFALRTDLQPTRISVFNVSFLAYTLLLAASFPATSYAGDTGVEARLVSPGLVEVEPGEIFAMSFRVTNGSDTREEFAETLHLPDGWRLVMPLFEFFLDPGGRTTRLLVLQVGSGAPAGTYEIAYHVKSLRDYALTDTAVVRALLPAVYDLSLIVEGKRPEQVIAGEPFQFHVRLTNEGNVELPVNVKGNLPGQGRVTVVPGSLRLPARECRRIQVTARADPERHKLQRQHLHLQATTNLEKDGRPLSARLSLPVDVIPLVAGEDMHHRYPVEVTGYLGGKDGDRSLQAGVKGSGYLDEAGSRRLDFVLQGPDQQNKGALGRRDEYWAHYREPRFNVRAGDQSYALSKLTSWHRYGRGLGVDVHAPGHPMGAGIYYVKDRWSYQKRRDLAGYLSFSPQPSSTLRLNLMTLDYESWKSRPSSTDTIASIEGRFDFRDNDHFEVEVGSSRRNLESAGSDMAWRSIYHGTLFNEVQGSFFARRAGPDFAGRYEDTAHYSGTITFPLSRAIHGNLSYSRYESNLEERPERGAASRETLYRAGIRINMPKHWTLNLDYDFYDRHDAQPAPTQKFQEQGLRLGIGRSWGPLSYRGQVRRVRTDDHLAGEAHSGWNYDVFTTYMLNRTLFFSFIGSFGDDSSPDDSRLLRRGRNVGTSIRWQPIPDFSAYLNYSRYDQEDMDRPSRERVESDAYRAGLTCRLANNHRIGFDLWRSRGNRGDSRTSYFLKYTIPLSVPLGRKKSVGALTGRVYRSDQPGNPGVEGAVVYVDGAATRTDSSGSYVFNTLCPGEYNVHLDERTVGLDSVPIAMASTNVTVVGSETAELNIALTETGTLSGRVVLVPGNSDTKTSHVVGLAGNLLNNGKVPNHDGLGNILVEMSRSDVSRRTVTTRNGCFAFDRLQPGTWTLKVYHHNLPEQHELKEPTRTVSIDPGEEEKIILRVVPLRRKIRFIDQGMVSAEPAGDQYR